MTKENKKKTLLWLIIALFAVVVVIIIWALLTRETAQAPETPEMSEDTKEVSLEVEENDMADWKTYENKEYGFSFKYPGEWENIVEKNIEKPKETKILKSIRYLSKANNLYYIQIQIVKIEDKNDNSVIDYPHQFITENEKYAFYYTSSGDCAGMPGCEDKKFLEINEEIENIVSTFLNKI